MIKEKIKEKLGIIYLDRPQKINALTLAMIRDIRKILEKWEENEEIRAILFDSTSEKGFCSGGDLKEVYNDYLLKPNKKDKSEFFREEFELDKYIASYKKPVISHWYGIVMGGGIGLSINSDIIITDETTNWAMPETRLGFVPDVGVCKYLSTLPQDLGQYLGLCGESLGASDLVDFKLCHAKISSNDYKKALDKLINLTKDYEAEKLVDKYKSYLESIEDKNRVSKIDGKKEAIKKYFSYSSFEEIYKAVEKNLEDDFAREIYDNFSKRPSFMLALQFEKYFLCKNLSYEETINLDYKILNYSVDIGYMKEGIRAVMVDKDNNPSWRNENIKDIDREKIKDLLGSNY